MLRIWLFVFAALITHPLVSAANEYRLSQDRVEAILSVLPGYWHGEAIETPVGPVDYDMLFHTCGDGTVAGVANTGASLHYWQFADRDETLRIRFLSTFAGNRTPVMLVPGTPEGATLNFFAPKREILTLGIMLSESQIDIRVFHHAKPHVHTQLTRLNNSPEEIRPHHTLLNSCRGSPTE